MPRDATPGSWRIGIVGGSGLYGFDGLEQSGWERVETPWGSPSDEICRGKVGEVELAFLPRHGRGHRLPPSEVNYRANIDALKRIGCTDIVSVSACGSLREEMAPGDFVVPDQFVDRTRGRPGSFFGPGCVAHVPMADPVCPRLAGRMADAAEQAGARVHRGGVYLAMEGPQFSTRAESRLHREWGFAIVGMTNMPESRLAREAELPYVSVCMVTDYDCWRSPDSDVDVTDVLRVLRGNVERAQQMLSRFAGALPRTRSPAPGGIEIVLDTAIITPAGARDPRLVAKLDAVAGRALSVGSSGSG